jgi:hypothetical protein
VERDTPAATPTIPAAEQGPRKLFSKPAERREEHAPRDKRFRRDEQPREQAPRRFERNDAARHYDPEILPAPAPSAKTVSAVTNRRRKTHRANCSPNRPNDGKTVRRVITPVKTAARTSSAAPNAMTLPATTTRKSCLRRLPNGKTVSAAARKRTAQTVLQTGRTPRRQRAA